MRRSQRLRRRSVALLFVVVSIAALLVWNMYEGRSEAQSLAGPQSSENGLVRIVRQPVSLSLNVSGTIKPGRSLTLSSPFDGPIKEKRVNLGDRVKTSDVVAVMDTTEIESRYREAQSAYLKASIAARALKEWEASSEVQRARRALSAAELALTKLERQVSETKSLLSQGIISQDEYDALAQQRDGQSSAVTAAQEDLNVTLERGNADSQQLASLDLENARQRRDDLQRQISNAVIKAPLDGIVIRPPESSSRNATGPIETGSLVARGAPIVSIADIGNFAMTSAVDEFQVNQLRVGQPVQIQSDAFGSASLAGTITSISAEAQPKDSLSLPSTFEIQASIHPSDAAVRNAIRIGMSARMTIQIYDNATALIIPPSAVIGTNQNSRVRVMRNGRSVETPVVLGKSFPQGVEIVSGLTDGDEIVSHPDSM